MIRLRGSPRVLLPPTLLRSYAVARRRGGALADVIFEANVVARRSYTAVWGKNAALSRQQVMQKKILASPEATYIKLLRASYLEPRASCPVSHEKLHLLLAGYAAL